jgi:hypothetical protein
MGGVIDCGLRCSPISVPGNWQSLHPETCRGRLGEATEDISLSHLLHGFTEHPNERKVPVIRQRLRVSLRLLKSSNTLLIVKTDLE